MSYMIEDIIYASSTNGEASFLAYKIYSKVSKNNNKCFLSLSLFLSASFLWSTELKN